MEIMAIKVQNIDLYLDSLNKGRDDNAELNLNTNDKNEGEFDNLNDTEKEQTEYLIIQTLTNLLLQVSNEILTIKS